LGAAGSAGAGAPMSALAGATFATACFAYLIVRMELEDVLCDEEVISYALGDLETKACPPGFQMLRDEDRCLEATRCQRALGCGAHNDFDISLAFPPACTDQPTRWDAQPIYPEVNGCPFNNQRGCCNYGKHYGPTPIHTLSPAHEQYDTSRQRWPIYFPADLPGQSALPLGYCEDEQRYHWIFRDVTDWDTYDATSGLNGNKNLLGGAPGCVVLGCDKCLDGCTAGDCPNDPNEDSPRPRACTGKVMWNDPDAVQVNYVSGGEPVDADHPWAPLCYVATGRDTSPDGAPGTETGFSNYLFQSAFYRRGSVPVPHLVAHAHPLTTTNALGCWSSAARNVDSGETTDDRDVAALNCMQWCARHAAVDNNGVSNCKFLWVYNADYHGGAFRCCPKSAFSGGFTGAAGSGGWYAISPAIVPSPHFTRPYDNRVPNCGGQLGFWNFNSPGDHSVAICQNRCRTSLTCNMIKLQRRKSDAAGWDSNNIHCWTFACPVPCVTSNREYELPGSCDLNDFTTVSTNPTWLFRTYLKREAS